MPYVNIGDPAGQREQGETPVPEGALHAMGGATGN